MLGGFLYLAQIEVLKGPQGSAFGRNATGGAISLITAKPEDGLSGEVSAGYGSFERKDFSGTLNYGDDQFGIRLSAAYEDSDGFIDNLATGNDDLGAKEEFLGRISLAWDPTDAVSVDYSYSIANYETVAPGQEHTTAISQGTAIFLGTLLGLTPLTNPPSGSHWR